MKLLVFAVVFGVSLLGCGLAGFGAELEVRLVGPTSGGVLTLELFDSANAFGDLRDPVARVRHPLDGRGSYRIGNLPPGEYALVAYCDENNNDLLDRNFIGIPREPLGFSNRYEPKGPPSYSRASFVLGEGETRRMEVSLRRPLGRFGRLGVGVGGIVRSTPYRGGTGAVSQVIPAISYTGDRVVILGPTATVGLVGSGTVRLAATGHYRMGACKEASSDFLTGMGDRKATVMAGLALQAELAGGVVCSLFYEHDLLDAIGGGAAGMGLGKSFQVGVFRFSPRVGVNWLSASLSGHDFGVPGAAATPGRPAYSPGETFSIEGGLGMVVEFTKAWLLVVNAGVERLDSRATDSPIVDKIMSSKGSGPSIISSKGAPLGCVPPPSWFQLIGLSRAATLSLRTASLRVFFAMCSAIEVP